MAAKVATSNPVPATVDHAGSGLSRDEAAQAMKGVVVPGDPGDSSKTSRKLQLSDFNKVRTLGTGELNLPRHIRSIWLLMFITNAQAHLPGSV